MKPIAKPDFDPITFSRSGTVEFADDDEAAKVLNKAVEMLKEHKDYYLEIQGHPAGESPADVDLALDRAKFALKWIQKQDGIDASRLRAVTIDPAKSLKDKGGQPRKVVTLELLQPAH